MVVVVIPKDKDILTKLTVFHMHRSQNNVDISIKATFVVAIGKLHYIILLYKLYIDISPPRTRLKQVGKKNILFLFVFTVPSVSS